MNIKSYRDLEVWQKAMDLTMECYKVTKEFPKSETYGMCNQIQRAAVSIPANIAEGRGRQYTKEFRQHLSIAYGSLMELETHILLAERLGYIDVEESKPLMSKTAELGRMINGLQRSLKNRSQGEENKNRPLTPEPRNPNPEKGFSLVELLISMVIATVVGLAGFVIFSTSNWSYKVQEDVAEAQQNVRVAMDTLAKDIRTAGFGLPDPPFSLSFTGLTITPTALPNPLTAPITVSNDSDGPDSITILGIGFLAGTLENDADNDGTEDDLNCNGTSDSMICLDRAESANNFFSGGGPYTYRPNRRYISLNGSTFLELGGAQTDANRAAGKLVLSGDYTLDRNYADGTAVYIIQAINYSIDTDNTLAGCSATNPCLVTRDYTMLRGGTDPGGREVLVENIEDLQLAYGIDANPMDGTIDDTDDNDDGGFTGTDYRFSEALDAAITDPMSIIAVRLNVVAMTRNTDPKGASGFRKQCLEDRSGDATCTGAQPDGYRRRSLTKIIKIRNPKTGT
ncbi:MAG: hypothetical protein A2235_02615 [Deltaproteobacteria bacterium RIFOXYA2_FULL_42_10]|nr:MAG: hypothetical protein A2235_02615 [Deltaproteobacteria bacterium RIFOXYA2_FULL_42_10]